MIHDSLETATSATSQTICADPLGVQPLFARRRPPLDGELAVSSRITELVTGSDEFDPLGLACLLSLGFPLGDRTLWPGIRRVNAGERVCQKTGAAIGSPSPLELQSRVPSDEQLHEIFMQALRSQLNGATPIVPLSGGRDSRLIYLGLRELGVRPRMILTSGRLRGSADALVAARLAVAGGDPIEAVPTLPFSLELEQWRHRAQSFESLEHAWFLSIALRARSLGGAVTDGIGLGVLPTGSLMKPEAIGLWRAGSLDELADWTIDHAAGAGHEFCSALRDAGVPLASDDEVRAALVDALREVAHFPNPLGAFSLFNWTRRGIAASAFGLLGQQNIIAPLIDPALASGLLAEDVAAAASSDWRERLLKRLDRTGVPFAEEVPLSHRSWRWRSPFGALGWQRLVRSSPRRFTGVLESVSRATGHRRSFCRSAIGLLRTTGQWVD